MIYYLHIDQYSEIHFQGYRHVKILLENNTQ